MADDADVLKAIDAFSLLGGPLQRGTRRLGSALGRTDHLLLGVAAAAVLWLVLMTLAQVEGFAWRLLSLRMIGGHVRIGLVIPLLFLCERSLDPRIRTFLRELVHSGVLPAHQFAELARTLRSLRRHVDGWLPDLVCLLAAVLMLALGRYLHLTGATAVYDPLRAPESASWTSHWYWFVCLTLYRVLMLRWLWRLCVWWVLLRRLSRLSLRLFAAHPDRMGGLGYLELVQLNQLPLVFALSAVQSAALAESISRGSLAIEQSYATVLLTLLVASTLVLAPMFFFVLQFWKCRVEGLSAYSLLASRYVRGFEDKWIRATPSERLLGSADIQSLADIGNSVRVVHELQVIPIPLVLLKDTVLSGLVPFAPLVLLKYPITEVAKTFLEKLL